MLAKGGLGSGLWGVKVLGRYRACGFQAIGCFGAFVGCYIVFGPGNEFMAFCSDFVGEASGCNRQATDSSCGHACALHSDP